jgi:hypothetical protein
VGLTTEDVNGALAQWDEWVTDPDFRLSIEVREGVAAIDLSQPGLNARVTTSLFCEVTVRRGDVAVFNDRIPHSAEALRASVAVLARTIASHQGGNDE